MKKKDTETEEASEAVTIPAPDTDEDAALPAVNKRNRRNIKLSNWNEEKEVLLRDRQRVGPAQKIKGGKSRTPIPEDIVSKKDIVLCSSEKVDINEMEIKVNIGEDEDTKTNAPKGQEDNAKEEKAQAEEAKKDIPEDKKDLFEAKKDIPEEKAEKMENDVNEVLDDVLREMCVRCETAIGISEPANILETIIQHCQSCPKKSSKDELSCYKCMFNTNFRGDFRTHIVKNHLKEDDSKKPTESRPTEEEVSQKRGALQDKLSHGNIPTAEAKKVPKKDLYDRHPRGSDDDSASATSEPTPSQAPIGHWCIHCKSPVLMEEPNRDTIYLVEHSKLCAKKKNDTLMCYKCHSSFLANGDLLRHITKTHFAKPSNPNMGSPAPHVPVLEKAPETVNKATTRATGQIDSSADTAKTFICRYCHQESASLKALQIHKYTHRIQ